MTGRKWYSSALIIYITMILFVIIDSFSPNKLLLSKNTKSKTKLLSQNGGIDIVTKRLTLGLSRLESKWKRRRVNGIEWIKLNVNEEEEEEVEEFVYVLPPYTTERPSCILIFIGGAGFGQFSHISYSELLEGISIRMNAAIITIPYQVKLDHFTLAKKCAGMTQKALWKCEDVLEWDVESLPRYALSHSLGSKLQLLMLAANTEWCQNLDGVGLMSYNNFGFIKSISMISDFIPETSDYILDRVLDVTQQITEGIGLEFYPSPKTMEEIIRVKLKKDLRLFCFDDDDLDSSPELLNEARCNIIVSGLPGTHLTPVYWKFSLDDVPGARDVLDEVSTFRGASFGNEENLNELVDEVYRWMIGKPSSNVPSWVFDKKSKTPKISAGREDLAE